MLESYAVGLAAILVLVVAWVAVQHARRRVFPDAPERPGCDECEAAPHCDEASKRR